MRVSDEELENSIYISVVAPDDFDLDVRLDLRDLRKLAREVVENASNWRNDIGDAEVNIDALKAHLEEKP